MEQPSDKIVRYLIIFAIAVALIKVTSGSGIFASSIHKGKGYLVVIPDGWKKVKKKKDVVYPKGVEMVTLVPKTIDADRDVPEVFISILTKKLATPIWIEDEWPDILRALNESGMKIKDKGQIKIDEVTTQWVVYHDIKVPALVLEFYMVTDTSVFYKMQYSADPEKFNVFRPVFEEFKSTFKFRFSMY